MTPEQFISLYEKYISGRCTPREEKLLFEHKDRFRMQESSTENSFKPDKEIRQRVFQRIRHSLVPKRSKIIYFRFLYGAAAALLIVLGAGLLYETLNPPQNLIKPIAISKGPLIKPGGNTAILTLADGSVIRIDKMKNGILTSAGKTAIKKMDDGQLVYEASASPGSLAKPSINTITIPRAGNFKITLPDGTRVWLNSESSLTFPTEFTGNERNVKLKGEAYFEVAKDQYKPFKVETDKLNVEVFGTHFNIRAYADDEAVYTTLLEGSVKLHNHRFSEMLIPGEQGVSGSANEPIVVKQVSTDKMVAWKSGIFIFDNENIVSIMQQIARWYDVEVEYRGNIKDQTFGGVYSKNKDLSQLLKSMELTKSIHFKTEGRRIIVMP